MRPVQDLPLGRYQPGDSGLYRLDPRAKIAAGLLLLVCLFWPGRPWSALWVGLVVVGGVVASRVPIGQYLRGLRPFLWLFGFTWLLHGFVTPGREVLSVPFTPLGLSGQGLTQGARVASRLAVAIGLSSLLTLTTRPAELARGLHRLTAPLQRLGLPVEEFGVVVFLALRFVPILLHEVRRAADSVQVGQASGWRERSTRIAEFMAETLRRAVRRAETLGRAMDRYGFRLGRSPSGQAAMHLTGADWSALVVSGSVLLAVLISGA